MNMKNNIISLLLISIMAAAGIAWVSQRLLPDETSGPSVQTVTIAKAPIEEDLPYNAATIRRESDGHYWTRADVNGSNIKFLVDTGASAVALNWHDAKRLRLDLNELVYDYRVTTAGGVVMAASVSLPSIRIGNVEIENVEALIMEEDLLENSLLGMSFLGELYSYEFKGRTLIIRK